MKICLAFFINSLLILADSGQAAENEILPVEETAVHPLCMGR